MSKKSRIGNKSFQPSSAGKGDGDRTSNVDAYRANYDSIDWGHARELENAYFKDPRFPGVAFGLSRRPLRFDSKTRGS